MRPVVVSTTAWGAQTMTDEEAEREAWKRCLDNPQRVYGVDGEQAQITRNCHNLGFRAGLAHARAEQAERTAALERVAEAARRHLTNSHCLAATYQDTIDALEALDRVQSKGGKDGSIERLTETIDELEVCRERLRRVEALAERWWDRGDEVDALYASKLRAAILEKP